MKTLLLDVVGRHPGGDARRRAYSRPSGRTAADAQAAPTKPEHRRSDFLGSANTTTAGPRGPSEYLRALSPDQDGERVSQFPRVDSSFTTAMELSLQEAVELALENTWTSSSSVTTRGSRTPEFQGESGGSGAATPGEFRRSTANTPFLSFDPWSPQRLSIDDRTSPSTIH